MDQSQTKALAALQPFIHLATTTKTSSPRFVAELIKSAISAPGAYLFTELLQTPAVQSLRGTEAESWLTLLEIFSWGTYEEYKATPNLPDLDDAQTLKLRQLSLLTLASPFAPTSPSASTTNALTYPSLLASLALESPSSLESLVTQSIYSGLLTARLSPTSQPPVVHITSVAPLRDLRPQSLPALLQILQTWESRCTDLVSQLDSQISEIHHAASRRTALQGKRQDVIDAAVLNDKPTTTAHPTDATDAVSKTATRATRGVGQRPPSKRDLDAQMEGEGDDMSDEEGRMDVDEGIGSDIGYAPSRGGHSAGGGSRGAKRNRGRGSK